MHVPAGTTDRKTAGARRRRWATRAVGLVAGMVAALAVAPPAGAAVTPGASGTLSAGTEIVGGTVTSVATDNGGTVTYANDASGSTTTITLGSGRTVIGVGSSAQPGLTVARGTALDLVFADRADTVVLRVDTDVALIAGRITTHVGAVGGPVGGNVWIVGPAGVTFSSGADVDAGGLLATAAVGTDADLLDGNGTTTFEAAPVPSEVQVLFSADITGHGGLVALVGQSVYGVGGSVVHDGSAGRDSDVLYGGAAAYTLTTVADSDGDRDLGAFTIPVGGESQYFEPVTIGSSTTAGSIFVASSSSRDGARGAYVSGPTIANGPQASQRGDVVVVSGGGVSRDAAGRLSALPVPGAAAQAIHLDGQVSTDNRLLALSNGDLHLGPAAAVSGPSVDLSAAEDFVKDPAAGMGPDWVIYAPTPANVVNGPDSGTTALWNRDVTSQPAGTISGPRYVFEQSPTLTFTARSLAKDVGVELDLAGQYDVSGFQAGVPGLFLGDDATTGYTGTPAVSSEGAAATAPSGSYPITIGQGSLASAAGYTFSFVPGGLTVNPAQPAVGLVHRAPVDAPPVMNVATQGRVVPVRVSLTGLPAGTAVQPLYAGTPQRVACTVASRTDAVETYTSRWAVATNRFVWDRSRQNWLYKLDTRALGLTRNVCYRVPVFYGGTVQGTTASGGTQVGFFYIRTR